jgi:hypothetical protein
MYPPKGPSNAIPMNPFLYQHGKVGRSDLPDGVLATYRPMLGYLWHLLKMGCSNAYDQAIITDSLQIAKSGGQQIAVVSKPSKGTADQACCPG